MTVTAARLPVPAWSRPGETWRVEAEPGGWQMTSDGGCSARHCSRTAMVIRPRDDFMLCSEHIRQCGMWIERDTLGRDTLVSWCLRP